MITHFLKRETDMKRLVLVSAFFVISLSGLNLLAQENPSTNQSVSLQPIFWLDSVVPREWIGISGQYELGISDNRSVTWRLFWFRMARIVFSDLFSGYEGVGISVEYRTYFSDDISGWHLGPFVEGVLYSSPGYEQQMYGNDANKALAAGIQAGYKYIKGHISFDVSLRAGWFSQTVHTSYGTFLPSTSSSTHFNSHMLISIGYAF